MQLLMNISFKWAKLMLLKNTFNFFLLLWFIYLEFVVVEKGSWKIVTFRYNLSQHVLLSRMWQRKKLILFNLLLVFFPHGKL